MSALSACLNPLLSLLYPPRCLVCSALGESGLCRVCAGKIVPVPAPFCAACGHPLPDISTPLDIPGGCEQCAVRRPAFARARAMGAYEGVLRSAVHQFKYRDHPQMALPLGLLLAEYAEVQKADLNSLLFDAVLPVPMHRTRQRVRGYNQSERLARVFAAHLGFPLWLDALTRPRPSRPQVGLSAGERRANLQGAFAVPFPAEVAGKTLLLIDDVMTTGSSLHEGALALKAVGANSVYALTLAAG